MPRDSWWSAILEFFGLAYWKVKPLGTGPDKKKKSEKKRKRYVKH